MNTMEKQARDKKERFRHLLLFLPAPGIIAMKNTAARRKGQTEATVYRRFFCFRRKK